MSNSKPNNINATINVEWDHLRTADLLHEILEASIRTGGVPLNRIKSVVFVDSEGREMRYYVASTPTGENR